MDSELINYTPKFYGISLLSPSIWKEYGYSLLTIAGSDGMVSDPEMEWLTVELAKANSVPEDIVHAWEDYDYDNADLEEVFSSITSSTSASFSKLLIYDAIRMASADGDYAMEEKQQVREAAKILGVTEGSVVAIEALVDVEQAADKLRMTVF